MLVRSNNDALPTNCHSMLTLWDGEWLDDNVIDGLFMKLRERDQDGENNYLSTHFWPRLYSNNERGRDTYWYESVQSWTRRQLSIDIFSKRKVLIPLNPNGMH